jgi:hypothetical protein
MAFKDQSFSDRQASAAKAKQAMLEKFRAKPGPDDPATIERQKARQAIIVAREERERERERARIQREKELAAQRAREAAEAAQRAKEEEERKVQEAKEAAERALQVELQKKAERDARYLARKERQKRGKRG